MEENGFNFRNFGLTDTIGGTADSFDPASDNVFSRFFDPSIAEEAQFERENYFVDKANAFNEYMYNRALEDNSPVAQMERAKEAGINTALAAGGIMGNGNAVAQPMTGAQGASGMNTNAASPIQEATTALQGLNQGAQAVDKLGEVLGYGKMNNAQVKQLNATADKAAEEADFTFWQKRQFRRTMRIMYDQAQLNLDTTKQNLDNLRKLNEVYQMQKHQLATQANLDIANTELAQANTKEAKERTTNWQYKNWEEKFKKAFRDTFGVMITENGLNMLVQAVLSGKGDIIIGALSDGIANMVATAKEKFREHIPDLLNPFDKKTRNWFNENIQLGKEHAKENIQKLKAVWDKMDETAKSKFKDFAHWEKEVMEKAYYYISTKAHNTYWTNPKKRNTGRKPVGMRW